MPGRILRRCDLCGRFHASYLVDDLALGEKIAPVPGLLESEG